MNVLDAAEAMVTLDRMVAAVKGQEGQESKFAKALATLQTLSRKEGIPLAIVCGLILDFSSNIRLSQNDVSLLDVALVMFAIIAPCFALSVYLEGQYLRTRLSGVSGRPFWFAVTRAHCHSYLLLLTLYCSWLAAQLWRE